MHPIVKFTTYDLNGKTFRQVEFSQDRSVWFLTGYSYCCFMVMYMLWLHFAIKDCRRGRPLSNRRKRDRLLRMANMHYALLFLTTVVFIGNIAWTTMHSQGYDWAFAAWLHWFTMALIMTFTTFNLMTVGFGRFSKIILLIVVVLFVGSSASYIWWNEADKFSMIKMFSTVNVLVLPAYTVLFCFMMKSFGMLTLWVRQDLNFRTLCWGKRYHEEGAGGQIRRLRYVRRVRDPEVEIAGEMDVALIVDNDAGNV